MWKDHKNTDKKVSQVNSYLQNNCSKKKDFIDRNNLKKEYLVQKKLHLNKKTNYILVNNFLRSLRSNF